jgi:hypothetical protein
MLETPHRPRAGVRELRRCAKDPIPMALRIKWNDAWESIPLEFADDVIERIRENLQPSHPLREIDFFPTAKLWRRWRYLLEDENDSERLWLLDMEKKKRIKGKTCYWFKKLESQEELDRILDEDLQWWVQYMKDAGAWEE